MYQQLENQRIQATTFKNDRIFEKMNTHTYTKPNKSKQLS